MSTIRKPMVRHQAEVQLQIRADEQMPDGIAGRVSGVALTYEVVDSYGTIFARGSANRSIESKVRARKVPLLMDHERRTGAHVGVVSMMQDVGDSLMMTADLFDTPEGRAAKEYVQAVIAAGATTGFSIGFVPRASERVMVEGKPAERFTEIELREVSITPMPAVPGADVLGARTETEMPAEAEPIRSDVELLTVAATAALNALPEDARAALLAQYLPAVPAPTAPTAPPLSATRATRAASASQAGTSTPSPAAPVSMDQRLAAVRSTFA